MKAKSKNRFTEIDLLRGIAVLLMVVFHAAYNLNFFELTQLSTDRGIWLLMARFVQLTFIITTGVTLHISYQRRLLAGRQHAVGSRILHAAKILALGMLITLITWLLFREEFVIFGVLHFFAFAILLGLPFLRENKGAILATLLLGMTIIITTPFLELSTAKTTFLLPLGLTPTNFQTLDYFPLLPWFGWFLMGITCGKLFYPGGKRKHSLADKLPSRCPLQFLGRHSLIIYLLHQPIIAGAVLLISHL